MIRKRKQPDKKPSRQGQRNRDISPTSAIPQESKSRVENNRSDSKMGRGRPTLYDPIKFPIIALDECKEGATNQQLARVLGVDLDTLNRWSREYEDFNYAIKAGRDEFDTTHVERSLLERALGFEYDEVRMEERVFGPGSGNGKNHSRKAKLSTPTLIKHVTRKKVLPDVTAIMFWLQNRQPHRWKNVRHVEANVSGRLNHNHLHRGKVKTVNLDNVGRKEAEQLADIIKKATEESSMDRSPA